MATKINFTYTGNNQTFTVPNGVKDVFIQSWGAAGGSQGGLGGPGGYSQGSLGVIPNSALTIIVGQGGIPNSVSQVTCLQPTFGGGGACTEIYKGSSGGGSGYIGGVVSALTLATTIAATTATPINPPFSTNANYIAGVGVAKSGSVGGNGLVVLTFTIPVSTLTKTVDKSFAAIGDVLNYTIVLNNAFNDTLSNIIFKDTIPNGTTFISNSLTVNGSQVAGSPQPPGVSLSDTSSELTTITFSVLVTTVPTVNPINNSATATGSNFNSLNSNIVATTINSVNLNATKVVNKNTGNIGDILTYTIPITNTGNLTASNILFIDTIPNGTSIVANSLKQDSTLISGSPNPPGVTLPNSIGVNKTTTVTFQVKITAIPNPNPIPNTASATSSFVIDSTTTPNRTGTANTNTNTVNTSVNFASLSGITKYVDKSYANCGDTITYTIVAPNSGTVSAQNVVFKDTIPNGTVFVPSSVYVNGTLQNGANPASGVTIPNIGPGATATLTFQVQVQC